MSFLMCVFVGLLTTTSVHTLPIYPDTSSPIPDVTAPTNQSELTSGTATILNNQVETSEPVTPSTPSPSQTTRQSLVVPAVAGEEDSEGGRGVRAGRAEVRVQSSGTEGSVKVEGQRVSSLVTVTVVQTNLTFSSLCSDMAAGDPKFCTDLAHTAMTLPSLPRLHVPQQKTVYTSLVASYNLTYQNAYLLKHVLTRLPCHNCDVNTPCDVVEHMGSDFSQDARRHCRLLSLLRIFKLLLDNIHQMLMKLHGSVPAVPSPSIPAFQDFTERAEFALAVLAVARAELAEAKVLIEQHVVEQLS